MKTKLRTKAANARERLLRLLRRWGDRVAAIPKIRAEGFEALVFCEMLGAWTFYGTPWFLGPVADFWRSVLPQWAWTTVISAIALLVLIGFLERNYRARRIGSLFALLLLATTGVWTVHHYPHYPFGFMCAAGAIVPFWLRSEFAAMKMRARFRRDLWLPARAPQGSPVPNVEKRIATLFATLCRR